MFNRLTITVGILITVMVSLFAGVTVTSLAAECDVPAPEGWSTVTVGSNDVLFDIALASGATVEELMHECELPQAEAELLVSLHQRKG